MPGLIRKRRYTLTRLSTLLILAGQPKARFCARELAERCTITYGSALGLMNGLYESGLVAKLDQGLDGSMPGQTRVYFQIAPEGKALARRVTKLIPDPVAMLRDTVYEVEG